MTKKICSKKQESMIADFLGWSVVSGSGARPNSPGDVVSDSWLGECKTHVEPSHKILFNFATWDKIEEEASSRFKFPAYFVDDGSQKAENTWVMFSSAFLDNCIIIKYPLSYRKNIIFSSDDLKKSMNDASKNSKNVVYEVLRSRSILYLTDLITFENLL